MLLSEPSGAKVFDCFTTQMPELLSNVDRLIDLRVSMFLDCLGCSEVVGRLPITMAMFVVLGHMVGCLSLVESTIVSIR